MKMDFGHFGDGADGGQQTPGTPQGQGPSAEPVFMHTMEHGGITCDVCNSAIRGFRYKCMECVDYDLCSGCERKGNHPGHVMMRIAFPEQARDAIRRFLGNVPGASGFDPRRAAEGLFGFRLPHHGGHGHGFGHHRGGHRFRGFAAPGRNPESEEGEGSGPEGPGDCPYGLGRKGMKKWAKCMKKMAYQQRRSAENYARAANAETEASANSASAAEQAPFDFTAAASQIQEFLNAFGIPIDVVELYDNFGNRGQPNETPAPTAEQSGSGQNVDNSGQSNEASGSGVGSETSQSASPQSPPQTLAATLQQLHLNNVGQTTNEQSVVNAPSAPVTMELDADSSGWTLLERERTPPTNEMTEQAPAAPIPVSLYPTVPSVTTIPVVTLGDDSSARGATATPTTSGPTSAPASYVPGISQPQLQQLLSGVSQAMNSVVRNIPIVTNPNPQEQEQGMDVKCSTTLKQLLAMGFSNQDGWLSRLVIAKKGDLESVLNALFPAGQ